MIQQELDSLSTEWNHHCIRCYNLSEIPSGVPEILISPSRNSRSYGLQKGSGQIYLLQEAESSLTTDVELTSTEFTNYAKKAIHDCRVEVPQNWNEALPLYFLPLEDMNT